MMRSTRSKIVLILLLCAQVITPMMRLPDIKSLFYNAADQNVLTPVLTVENYLSLGVLTFQVASFVWLTKKNALFGIELMPERINILGHSMVSKNVIAAGAFLGLLFAGMFTAINMAPQKCIHSDTNTGMNTLLLASSIVHISNLIHDDALEQFKKNLHEMTPPTLILKQMLDVSALDKVQCLMCLDDACTCGYVNLCNKKEHIVCGECIISWFKQVKQKTNFAKKNYFCEFCRIEVPRNDEKFEIIMPPEPKVTFGLWLKQMGPMVFFYGLSLYMFMKIMQCQFS